MRTILPVTKKINHSTILSSFHSLWILLWRFNLAGPVNKQKRKREKKKIIWKYKMGNEAIHLLTSDKEPVNWFINQIKGSESIFHFEVI